MCFHCYRRINYPPTKFKNSSGTFGESKRIKSITRNCFKELRWPLFRPGQRQLGRSSPPLWKQQRWGSSDELSLHWTKTQSSVFFKLWVTTQKGACFNKVGESFFPIDSRLPQFRTKIVSKVWSNLSGMTMTVCHCFFSNAWQISKRIKQKKIDNLWRIRHNADRCQLLDYV